LEPVATAITAEGSLGIAKWLIGAFRGVQLIIPKRYQDVLRLGVFYTNAEASRAGFNVVLKNYSSQLATVSFFRFQSVEKIDSKRRVNDYPMIRLAKNHLLASGNFVQIALPWKEVVLSALEADYRKFSPPEKKSFRFRLTAYDEFIDKFYRSSDLNQFFIRGDGLYRHGDTFDFTDEELEKAGWYRSGNLLVNKARDSKDTSKK
jgi:hypothetical protein